MSAPDSEVGQPAPGRARALVLVPLAIFAALAGLFLVRLFAGDPSQLPSALVGRPAPQFSLPPLAGLARDGVPVPGLASADLKAGAVTIVNVWASWCGPCRDEHPQLMQLAKDSRVRVVGINYKDQSENARRFLGALGNPFVAVGDDANGRVGIDWGVYGVPETFVISPDGTIAFKHVGPLSPATLEGPLGQAIARAAKPPG
jgi:cytochrome c biogenesis protein CcmG, thiol:disulfide interchange protein DsbE